MKTLPKTLCISLSLLAVACGNSKPTPDPLLAELEKKGKTIDARKGTGEGTTYNGNFESTLSAAEVKCQNPKGGFTVDTSPSKFDCNHNAGVLSCKSLDDSNGTVLKGFVDKDGTFGLHGSLKFKGKMDDETVDIVAAGVMEGKFADGDNASGTFQAAASGQIGTSKDSCTIKAAIAMKRLGGTPQAAGNMASLEVLENASSNASSTYRHFKDVRVRRTDEGVQIGAKGLSNQAILSLHEDGTADLITSNRSINGCRYDEETQANGRSVTFECDGVEGSAFLPKNSF